MAYSWSLIPIVLSWSLGGAIAPPVLAAGTLDPQAVTAPRLGLGADPVGRDRRAQAPNAGEPGETFEGSLSADSPTLGSGNYYVVYNLQGTEGETLRLTLESEEFDAYLLVLNGAGETLVEDDDSGGGSQAQIVVQWPESGSYQVLVTSYEPGQTGTYRLGWQQATALEADTLTLQNQLTDAETLSGLGQSAAALAMVDQVVTRLPPIAPHLSPLVLGQLLNRGADLYRQQGEIDRSLALYQQALETLEAALGADAFALVESLNGLALVYRSQGQYLEAEKFYGRAIRLYEQRDASQGNGEPSTNLGIVLDNLANIYRVQGNYGDAEPLARRAFAIFEANLGPNHPTVATSLNNLAALAKAQGNYGEASRALEQALAIAEANLGVDHPNLAIILSNLGAVYDDRGLYDQAEPYYQRSLALLEANFSPGHPSILISLNNLSRLEYNRGNYGVSENLYDRVITATRASLGDHHPNLAIYLKNSADTHLAQGHYGAALAALGETLALEEQSLGVNLAGLGEQQRRDYLNTLNTTLDPLLTLHLQHLPQDATAATLALTAILQRKGRVLDAASLSLQRLRQNLTADDRQRFDRLNATRTQLANRINQGVGDQDPETYQSQIQTLENELERQEKELAQRSTAFQQTIQPITVEAVRQGLPQDAALIEFFRYHPVDATAAAGARLGDARYAAYVLRPGGEVVGVDLGDANTIDQRLQTFRRFLRDPSQPVSLIKALGQRLYQQLITPLLPYGGEASHWLISPDSQLNLLSFATLVDEQGNYLLQSRDITYLSSGRDLLRFDLSHFDLSHFDLPHRNSQESPARPQAAAIIANPDYNLNADLPLAPSLEPDPAPSTRSAAMAATPWSPLPGTAEEAAVLQTLLPQAQVFSEAQATEFQVKTLANPQILHLATHGFFLPMDSDGDENPLLRSGLILAGANQRLGNPESSGSEDGILTALEVSGLDLQNTEMVVLSACETGLGDVTDGEGVYGLRRAFTLTGAASQVMTLWSVPDRETLTLMAAYYQGLVVDHHSRATALRQIQQQMLANPATAHPFYWAAFILSGQWTPLVTDP